ncbi:MAG TPA: polysaccharide deacetylase family protein [Bryobacteraceae bacterium]|nr:polysaccharide deacetylase family protein [Bryobacteraceae bacterium]
MPRVVLGIDCETDVGSWTPYYEGLVHATPVILKLLDRHGITATFFFTGDSARKHPEVLRQVHQAGHEVGCHSLYHETVGDPLFEIPGVYPLLPEEVENRLRVATDVVADVAGFRPVSFRAPRLFGSTAMVNALESLGYLADASYPMYYYRERLTPYHPSREDWTKEGTLRVMELPNFADLSMDSEDPYGRDMDQWPLFRTAGAPALMHHVDGYMRFCERQKVDPFLCFYFHPWEFHPMPEGEIHYGEGSVRPDPFIVKNTGPYAVEQFDVLLGMLRERGAQFFQARQIAQEAS